MDNKLSRHIRAIVACAVLFALLSAACSDSSTTSQAEIDAPTVVTRSAPTPTQVGLADPSPTTNAESTSITGDVGSEADGDADAGVATAAPADATTVSAESAPPEPAGLGTPIDSGKNQPVFRQAQTDGDTRSSPQLLALDTQGTVQIEGEVSALTDRVDVVALTLPEALAPSDGDDPRTVTVAWRCPQFKSEDGRPLRIIVERDGAAVSESICTDVLQSGSAQITIGARRDVQVVLDSGSAAGGNFYASYTVSARVGADTGSTSSDESTTREPTPAPQATPGVEATPTPDASPPPDTEANPEPTPTPQPTSTPEPTPSGSTTEPQATPTPTPTPESTPTESEAGTPTTPEPTPTPVPADVVVDGAVDDDQGPATGSAGIAPEDGDSRSNPQRPGDSGFLVGSVSAPSGDSADWSSFEVRPGDPTSSFVVLLCASFQGSGTLTVTIASETSTVGELRCTLAQPEDSATLELAAGVTYLVAAEFQGSGYTDWFLQAGDDD